MKKRYCNKCGSQNLIRHSKENNKQRWECMDCGKRSVKTLSRPPKPLLDTDVHYETLSQALKRKEAVFIITAAQNATPVHTGFFKSLETYCKHRKAQLIIVPYLYRNVTSSWLKEDEEGHVEEHWWVPEVSPYLMDQRLELNRNLVLLGNIKIQPTAVRPLSGLDTISGDKSGIVGHSKIELKSIPTPQNKMPKILVSTGTCTRPNYTPTKTGSKAEFHHIQGALVVELKNGYFHLRQINANQEGHFTDLDIVYSPDGVQAAPRAAALVMGDSHWEFMAPQVRAATFDAPDSILKALKPRYLVWHDAWDGYAMSHHHRGNPFLQYAKQQSKRNVVKDSLDSFFGFVDKATPAKTKNIFVASNHPEFLMRWLKETDPRSDTTNGVFWCELYKATMEGTKAVPEGTFIPDPFAYYGSKALKCWNRTRFLKRGENFTLLNVELGYHGDKGNGGRPGTLGAYANIGVKSIVGHHHFIGIMEGAYLVGTSSYINLDYTLGNISAAMNAHCVLYADGKRSLILIMPDGSWKA